MRTAHRNSQCAGEEGSGAERAKSLPLTDGQDRTDELRGGWNGGQTLKPNSHSMCIFPSRTLHAVTDIEMSQEDIGKGYGRYCISQFAKYDNNIK